MKFKCIHCEEENDIDIQDLMQEYVEQGRTEATESFQTEKATLEGKAKEKGRKKKRKQLLYRRTPHHNLFLCID